MDKVLGVINLINEGQYLKELTKNRCLASVPFGGRYRLIDFTLSNFFHAGVKQVGVFTKEKSRSIMDHLGSGKEWDLDRRSGGLYVLPPRHPEETIKGDLQQFQDNIEIFKRSNADTVIISPGHHVCKMDFREIIQQHRDNQADITIINKKYNDDPVFKPMYHKCHIDDNGDITDIELYSAPLFGDSVCLETYIINKDLLLDIIHQCVSIGEYDFLKDGIKANLHEYKVKSYEFKGYLPLFHSIEGFLKSNMSFLNPDIIQSFFYEQWDVYTKVKHEPPAKYALSSNVTNSLIANGCIINGTVENSIIFRGVNINKGATIKNCIIMQKCEIEENATLENVIADKQVIVTKDKVIIGDDGTRVLKKLEVV